MGFNPSHGVSVIDFLATHRTIIVLQRRNREGLTSIFACPVPPHLLDFVTAARWADCNVYYHAHPSLQHFLGRNEKVVGLYPCLMHKFALRVKHQSLQIGALDNVEVLLGMSTVRAL